MISRDTQCYKHLSCHDKCFVYIIACVNESLLKIFEQLI